MERKCEYCNTTITLKQKDIKKSFETIKEKETIAVGLDNLPSAGGKWVPYHSGCVSIGFEETGRYITKKYLCFEFKCPLCTKINSWRIEE